MELCTGGSLYEVIDSPENAYGLNETEFKQVIFDVGKYGLYSEVVAGTQFIPWARRYEVCTSCAY